MTYPDDEESWRISYHGEQNYEVVRSQRVENFSGINSFFIPKCNFSLGAF